MEETKTLSMAKSPTHSWYKTQKRTSSAKSIQQPKVNSNFRQKAQKQTKNTLNWTKTTGKSKYYSPAVVSVLSGGNRSNLIRVFELVDGKFEIGQYIREKTCNQRLSKKPMKLGFGLSSRNR